MTFVSFLWILDDSTISAFKDDNIDVIKIIELWDYKKGIGHTGATVDRQLKEALNTLNGSPPTDSSASAIKMLNAMRIECKTYADYRLYADTYHDVIKYKSEPFIFIDIKSLSVNEIDGYESDGVDSIKIDSYGRTPLMQLIYHGDSEGAIQFFDDKRMLCKPQHIDVNGDTAFILACKYGLEEVAIALINVFGRSCFPEPYEDGLCAAIIHACNTKRISVVDHLIKVFKRRLPKKKVCDWLIENKLSDCIIKLIDKYGSTWLTGGALSLFCKACAYNLSEVAIKILDVCGTEHIKDGHDNKSTKLMISCLYKMDDVAHYIIDNYSDYCEPDRVNNNGETALIIACKFKLDQIVNKLIRIYGVKCIPQQIDDSNKSALEYIIMNKKSKIAIKLLDKFGSQLHMLRKLFIITCSSKLDEVAIKIIDVYGVNNFKKAKGSPYSSILMIACMYKMDRVAHYIIDTYADYCEPDRVNKNMETALSIACKNGMTYIAIKLVEVFGDACVPDHINKHNKTSLIIACQNKLKRVVKILVDTCGNKCLPSHKDNYEYTALVYAYILELNDIAIKLWDRFKDKALAVNGNTQVPNNKVIKWINKLKTGEVKLEESKQLEISSTYSSDNINSLIDNLDHFPNSFHLIFNHPEKGATLLDNYEKVSVTYMELILNKDIDMHKHKKVLCLLRSMARYYK